MRKILFFSPYYTIIDWAKNSFFLRNKIFDNSDVRTIDCNSILNKNCVAIMAHSNKFSKDKICKRCISNKNYFSNKNKSFTIENYLNFNDKKKINIILKKISKKNFLSFKYQGFAVGKISAHENFIKFKKENFELNSSEFNQLLSSIENILINIFALNKITKEFIPDILVTDNGHYSLSRLYVEYFKKLNCKTYTFDNSPNNSIRNNDIHIYKNSTFEGQQYIKKKYKQILFNQKIFNEGIDQCLNHFRYAFSSKALKNYSKKFDKSKFDVRKYFKIKKNQKIILLTTSSWDEVIGTALLYYKNPRKYMLYSQIEAIKKAIKFVEINKKYFLIIRQHPRDALNKNSDVTKLLNNLKNLPKNIILNTPKDKISIYNILKETNMVLNSWSSVGLEASILGIPVINLTNYFVHYPNFTKYEYNYLTNQQKKKFKLSKKQILNIYKFIYTYYYLINININKKQPIILDKFLRLTDKLFLFINLPSIRKFFLKYNNLDRSKINDLQKSFDNYDEIIFLKKNVTKNKKFLKFYDKIIYKNYKKIKSEIIN